MPQTRATFAELYDNLDRDVFTLLGKEYKEQKPIWRQIYRLKESNRRSEDVMTVTGMGDVQERTEGTAFPTDIVQVGYTKQYIHTGFGLAFEVTIEALEDDRYDVLAEYARWLMFSARVVEEKRAALPFNNGFTTETTPDGLSVFNSAHTLKGGGTARNVLATASDLSFTALVTALTDWQRQTLFESGQFMQAAENLILYVPPELEFLGHRLVASSGIPESADNDVNAVKALRTIKVIKNVYLTDTDAWFLLDGNKNHGFCSYTRIPIQMLPAMTDVQTRNRHYPLRFRRSWGVNWWQGSFGTAGG